MIHKCLKPVRDLCAFRAYLVAGGLADCSVMLQDGKVTVHAPDGSGADISSLERSYVEPDYYEISSTLPRAERASVAAYVLQSGKSGKFTIVRRSGSDGSVKPDPSTALITWHGHEAVQVSPSERSLASGSVEVTLGPIPKASGGGYLFVDNANGDHAHVFVEVR